MTRPAMGDIVRTWDNELSRFVYGTVSHAAQPSGSVIVLFPGELDASEFDPFDLELESDHGPNGVRVWVQL